MTTHTAPRAEGSPYSRHLPALDGIRGLAALGVLCSHLFPANAHNAAERFMVRTLEFGANGVDLFFVLSGFLITGILFESLGDSGYFRKFYARRALRIFPVYYLVLGIMLALALVQHGDYNGQLAATALYLQNTWLLGPPVRQASGHMVLPLSHFWSLAIEEQFYLGWPLVVYLLRGRARLLALAAGSVVLCPLLRLALTAHGWPADSIHTNVFTRADSLLAGGALALALRGRFHDTVLRWAPWLMALGLLVFPSIAQRDGADASPLTFVGPSLGLVYTAMALASVGVLAFVLRPGVPGRVMAAAPLRWVGRYSYGIYVYHLVLFYFLEKPLRDASQQLFHNKGLAVLVSGVSIFAITLLAAWLSYNLVEKQFLRLKRYFDYRPHPNSA